MDPEDVRWYHIASCRDMPVSWFFEDYESDKELAKQIDQICISCPAIQYCYKEALANKDWGVRGGIYLVRGKADRSYNQHKTPEVWRKIKKILNG